MLAYNEIKPRKYIVLGGEPYEVLEALVFRKQKRKPVNQTRLRNLKTGSVVEQVFHHADRVSEAELSKRDVVFLFKKFSRQKNEDEYWFSEKNDPSGRFHLTPALLDDGRDFLAEKAPVTVLSFEDEIIGTEIPIKMTLRVADAPPAVRGDTAQGGTKQVVLETGITINAPLFIEAGDLIVVNTETREYVERAK